MNKRNIKRQLWFAHAFFYNFVPYIGILPIIYINWGLSLQQIGIVSGVASILICLMEVPLGLVSDKIGHFKSMIYGEMIAIIGIIYTIISNKSFFDCLLWVFLQSISIAFISGTDSSLLFTYASRNQYDYTAMYSKYKGISKFANSIPLLVIASIRSIQNVDILFYFSLCAKIFALIILFIIAPDEEKANKSSISQLEKSSFLFLINSFYKNKKIYIQFFSLTIIGIIWEYKTLVLNEFLTGNVNLISQISSILMILFSFSFYFAKYTLNLLERIAHSIWIPIICILGIVLFLINNILFTVISIACITIISSAINAYLFNSINNLIANGERATVLSNINLVDRFVYFISISLFSYSVEYFSLNISFIILFSFLLIVNLLTSIRIKTYENK